MREIGVDQRWAQTTPVAALTTIKALLLLSLLLLPAFAAEDGLKMYQDRKGDLFLVLEHRYFKPSLEGTTVEGLMTKCVCSSMFRKRRLKSATYVGYSFHHNDTCTLLTTSNAAGSLHQYIYRGTASETDNWEASNYERGARLVIEAPSSVKLGTDRLFYSKSSPDVNNLDGCRTHCSQYAGFRLAQAKTNLTMTNLRQYDKVYIDLRAGMNPPISSFIWGDETTLDRSLMRTDREEPFINDQATEFVMWPAGVNNSLIDDCPPSCVNWCLCQGNFANVPW